MEKVNSIEKRIQVYKRKYYFNLLLKGVLLSCGMLLFVYLFYALLEHLVNWNFWVRAFLFYSYVGLMAFLFFKMILLPLFRVFYSPMQISDEAAASQIGSFFPGIRDKLLNIIQLQSIKFFDQSLILASIDQKSSQIGDISFSQAISFKENQRYAVYAVIPILLIFLTSLISPGLLNDSSKRIIHYSEYFPVQAPFTFTVLNKNLTSFKNEDFDLKAKIEGSSIPDEVYLVSADKKLRIVPDNGTYNYTFRNLIDNINFHFEAAGYRSADYTLKVHNRPNIKNFKVQLNYPGYLHMKPESFSNIGNFQIPEGTFVHWNFETLYADSVSFEFEHDSSFVQLHRDGPQKYSLKKRFLAGDDYEIHLTNAYARNKDKIRFHIDAIPDEFPSISLHQYQDTVLYQYLILGGNINDDHGFTDLKLYYRINDDNGNSPFHSLPISITNSETSQNFYFHWNLDSLHLRESDKLEYYVQVRDNDGIKGPKASKTGVYLFRIPGQKEMQEELATSSQNSENQLDKNVQEAQKFRDQLNELEDRLKGKREMDWQDRKMIEELAKEKKELEDKIKKLQELYQANILKMDRFKNQSEKIKEKTQELESLFNDLMDNDTKKLLDELNKLLDENKSVDDVKDLIDKINYKNDNLIKNLERSVELYKRLKYESKLDETVNQINNIQKVQDSLSNSTEDKKNDINDLSKTQEKLNNDFQDARKNIEEMLDLNQDLKSPFPVENTMDEEKNVQQQQKNASENLQQGSRKNASQAQKQAAEQLKQLADKLGKMEMSGEMSSVQEDLGDLRGILDNLLKLSFEQEDLMDNIRNINLSDPRFNELSQEQLNIRDESKIVEDSLMSLASREVMISSFITRKIGEMNQYIDQSTDALKERKKAEASGLQQFSMTSMNDLALLLQDVMSAMQQQLASMMGIPSKSKQKGNEEDMSELQEQLNQEISQLKKSGKTGREFSEEVARLAAEQEKIRHMFEEERQKSLNKESGDGSSDDLIKKMKESELDLVNKNITQQLINRQKDIQVRLLESEKAMREQELDQEREGVHAKNVKFKVPPALQEYLNVKEKEVELLQTVPPKLNPYYKKEVNDYFKRLQSTSQ